MNNINLESQFIGTGKTNNQIIENKIIRESDQQFAVRDIQRLNEIIEENYTIEELLEIVERAVNCANCRKSI